MGSFQDLSGLKINRIKILSRAPNKGKATMWFCLCDCGSKTVVRGADIKLEKIKSCGCLRQETRVIHGGWKTSEHDIWLHIRYRCNSPSCKIYKRYGGRGISLCERWNLFKNFLEDMGPRPGKQYSIERINNDGNYEPNNCRWATAKEQAQNRRPKTRKEKNEQYR